MIRTDGRLVSFMLIRKNTEKMQRNY